MASNQSTPTESASRRSEYEAAFNHGAASVAIQSVGNTQFAVLPPGYSAEDVETERFQHAPNRLRAQVDFDDAVSFIAYVNLYARPGSQIFASRNESRIRAVLDYHEDMDTPSWCTHKATLNLSHTEEWKRWSDKNEKVIPQLEFGEFLENNVADIVDPDGATILEAAMALEVNKSVHFKSGRNLTNGTVQLQFIEEIDGNTTGGLMTLPTRFKLLLSPYVGGTPVEVSVRLRYRINGQQLSFIYLIDRKHKVLEAAFDTVLAKIAAETESIPLLGTWKGGN